MATAVSKESAEIRDKIMEIVQKHPEGISPANVYIEIYGKKPDLESYDDLNAKQRVYYWLKSLSKSKHVTQFGKSHASMYRVNGKRPTPDVADIPKERRSYTKRAQNGNGKHNGVSNNDVIAYIIDDLSATFSAKLAKLRELIAH